MDSWKPSANIRALRARAHLLQSVRTFFIERNVLEVETPLLGKHTVTAPYINSFKVLQGGGYLQTSPEYAMKRLLAAGSGCIFQICKAFRQAERGSKHNSEFTLLEWYRVGMGYSQLMEEVAMLLRRCLGNDISVEIITYRDAFMRYTGIDPYSVEEGALKEAASQWVEFQFEAYDRNDYLDLLLTHCVEPHLGVCDGKQSICFLTDYPASQAALACTQQAVYGEIAMRFEVFVNGVELANAYQELSDACILKTRWHEDQQHREALRLPWIDADDRLLAAQVSGLPECSGIALGIDRLLMLMLDTPCIEDVISFTDERA